MKTPEANQQPTVDQVLNRYAPPAAAPGGMLSAVMTLVASALPSLRPDFEAASPKNGALYMSRNRANQTIVSENPAIATALETMETQLQKSFQSASRPGATAEDRREFTDLARQIQSEARVLSGEYSVRGPADPATGGYKFVVADMGAKQMTLGDAFALVQKQSFRTNHDFMRMAGGSRVMVMLPAKGFTKARLQPNA